MRTRLPSHVIPVDPQTVICDSCNGDFTLSAAEGGAIVEGEAYCPGCCAAKNKKIQQWKGDGSEIVQARSGERFTDLVQRYREEREGGCDIRVWSSSAEDRND